MDDDGEIQIIERCLKNDISAKDVLVRFYIDTAFNIALKFTGDVHLAEDVVQDSFIKAFSSLKRLKEKSRFRSWFLRIVVNKSRDTLRKRDRYNYALDFESLEASVFNADEFQPEQTTIQREELAILLEAVRRLPDKYREVFVLRGIEGMEYGEIGGILRQDEDHIRVKFYRSREILKRILGEKE